MNRYICSLVFILANSPINATVRLADVDIPGYAKTALVSNNISQNGMILSISTFTATGSVDRVLDFYRGKWQRDGDIPGYIENNLNGWTIISRLVDDQNIVLQVRQSPNAGVNGFISIATKSRVSATIDVIEMPENTELLSSSSSEIENTSVLTQTYLSTQSASSIAHFIQSSMKNKGWIIERSDSLDGSQLLMFYRRADRCEVVISAIDNQTNAIYINKVQRDA